MVIEIFTHHNDRMAGLIGREYATGTLDRYKTSYKHTQAFFQWK
jgi:hypothetical protein